MPRPTPSLESRVEYPWILDELEGFPYTLKRFFGCTAIYEGPRILLILHHRRNPHPDDGVWVATTSAHHPGLLRDFPELRPVEVIGGASSDWRLLPEGAPSFESSVRRVCELLKARDPRLGKVPKSRQSPKKKVDPTKPLPSSPARVSNPRKGPAAPVATPKKPSVRAPARRRGK